MGVVTTTSERFFAQAPETVYDFVTDPANWPLTYPSSTHTGKLPELPISVGDTWEESGPDPSRIFTWQCAVATRPRLFVFTSLGRLGPDREGKGGVEARITVRYHFSVPGETGTLFSRTMTLETYRDHPLPDNYFRIVNPAIIDQYHAAIARELDKAVDGTGDE